jgi:citrate lyase beta subunit
MLTLPRARRALLYMPGDDRHKIEKALTLDVDCICMDMEDGVAFSQKQAAHQIILQALHELDFGRSEKLVRINPVGSGMEEEDLQTALAGSPDGIVLPKAETAGQVAWALDRIHSADKAAAKPDGSTSLIVIIETPQALLNLKEIAGLPGLSALVFGAEDLTSAMGAIRTPEACEVLFARSAVVTAAAAFGLQAIDMVNVDFKDLDFLRKEALFGAQLGYCGKQIIHPSQVKPVQEVFTPNDESIEKARRLLETFRKYEKGGQGAYAVDGKMIDMPLVRAAENILVRAAAAGKIHGEG